MIRTLDLAPPARLLEFGPGFGKLTSELVRTEFDVTVVDINPLFLALLCEHCDRNGLIVNRTNDSIG